MLSPKVFIWIACCLLVSVEAFAQRPKVHNGGKSMYTKGRYNVNATRVRGHKAKTMCPILSGSKYPYHGIGIKLGDPFAITYKFYASKRWAVAVDAGKASSGLYNRYYIEKFEEVKSDAAMIYSSHRVKSDFIGEIKVLHNFDASQISPGLQVYAGVGWEWKSTNILYSYSLPINADQTDFGQFNHSRFTQGPQIVIGIEYSYFNLPISAFMEVEYFKDIQADPGWQKIEGGVGLRYIF